MLQSFISGLCRAKTKSLLKQRPSSENHDTSTANHAQTHTVRDSKQRQIKPTEQIKKNQTPRPRNKTNQKLPKRCVQRNGHTCGICLTAREGEKKIREVMSIERLELENRVVRLLSLFFPRRAGRPRPSPSQCSEPASKAGGDGVGSSGGRGVGRKIEARPASKAWGRRKSCSLAANTKKMTPPRNPLITRNYDNRSIGSSSVVSPPSLLLPGPRCALRSRLGSGKL